MISPSFHPSILISWYSLQNIHILLIFYFEYKLTFPNGKSFFSFSELKIAFFFFFVDL